MKTIVFISHFILFGTLLAAAQQTQQAEPANPPAPNAPSPQSVNSPPTPTNLIPENGSSLPRSASAPISPRAMDMLDDRQKLGIGDRLIYRVIEDQDEPKSLVITDAGEIDVPYYGLVTVANKTCKQLAQEIKVLLEKQHYYQATVIIGLEQINKRRSLGRIYIVGQVRQNGAQEIPDDEVFTVSKAILKAGGFSDFADKKRVRLVRAAAPNNPDKKTIVLNVAEIWEKGKTENDIKLEPDDLIFVPARLINF